MSTTVAQKSIPSLTAGKLPRGTTPGVLVASVVVTGAVTALFGGFNLAGTVVGGIVVFLVAMYAASWAVEGRRKASDRLATHLVFGAFALALIPLASVTWEAVSNGVARFDVQFFTYSMRNVVGAGGGAAHALVGTLWVTGLATLISVPIGLMTAVYLSEYGRGTLARSITFFVDVMTGIPSIVAGLFAFAVMSILVGPGTVSGLSGAIALSVLMIPVVVRSTEELLRIVPNELREASYALGVPKWRTILRVVMPTALSGIVAGVILAIARVIGETAPLMIAAGFTQSMNANPLSNAMMTMPVFVYDSYAHPGVDVLPYTERSWAGALALIAIVMILNLVGRFIAARFAPRTGR
ncbi:phosphate ABC transporter permease PstA [Propionicicella superfundia]|uniref:phosphate ABC transporter permease PstA n=1 Tax=Propionicicella superfundia TaxID=348582 RepID=UPI0004160027|nr:phosphate ABC transporter permease PstA [Propionicicella superfundia]